MATKTSGRILQPSLGSQTTTVKGKRGAGVIALDLYDGVLRIAIGNSLDNISYSERSTELSLSELELNGHRLSSYKVLATEESQAQITAVEQLGLKVEALPRLTAIYWSFREETGDDSCLALSISRNLAQGGLLVDGVLDSQQFDDIDLSLSGIWNKFVASNKLLKKLIASCAKSEDDFGQRVFESFISALNTGAETTIGPIVFAPPFDFSASFDDIRRFLKSIDPDHLAKTIILADWAAKNSNLSKLLEGIDLTVLNSDPRDAFLKAARGMVVYSLNGSPHNKPVLSFGPKHILFQRVPIGESGQSPLTIKNTGVGILRCQVTTDESWLKVVPTSVVCKKGQERVVSIHLNSTGLLANNDYLAQIQVNWSTSGQNSSRVIEVKARTVERVDPIKLNLATLKAVNAIPVIDESTSLDSPVLDLPPIDETGTQQFPSRVNEYLESSSDKKTVTFDTTRGLLMPARGGVGVLSVTANKDGSFYLLPRVAEFSGEDGFQQYFKTYFQTFYECSGSGAGELWIISPAVVERVKGGWRLSQKGVLRVGESEGLDRAIIDLTLPAAADNIIRPNDKKRIIQADAETIDEAAEKSASDFAPTINVNSETDKRKWIIAVSVAALVMIIALSLWLSRSPSPRTNPPPVSTAPVPPENMVAVPGGKFLMGNDQGDDYEKPAHEVTVGHFYIDKYEVTCEEYARFVKDKNYPPPPQWNKGAFPAGWAHLPVTGVTWDDANAYARWAGKRLPTEEEWEFASRGTTGWRYPWGNDWKAGFANAENAAPGLTEADRFKGASPFGAIGMVGNAWEWTASNLAAYPGGRLPPDEQSDGRPNLRVIRGGSWQSDRTSATTTYRWGWPASGGKDYSNTGFRCVKDAQ